MTPAYLPHVTPHLFHKYCDTDHNPSIILPITGRYMDYEENMQVRRELEDIKQGAVGAHFDGHAIGPFYGMALLMEKYLNDLLQEKPFFCPDKDWREHEDLVETVCIARANSLTISGFMPKTSRRTELSLPILNGGEISFLWEDGAVYLDGPKRTFLGSASSYAEFRTTIQANLHHMLLHLFSDVED